MLQAKPEPPITTVIKNENNICKITFSPNIVQQAKITTNGILGDFVIRYDVQRDMGIGDIQVRVWSHPARFSGLPPNVFVCLHKCYEFVKPFFLSQVLNGHFVHYFAPKDLPVVPKNVVFVIDTSASMLGTKIKQVETRSTSRFVY